MTKRLPGPRPTDKQRAAGRRNSLLAQAQGYDPGATLRRWHVTQGHMVKDPTPDELMAIAAAREARAKAPKPPAMHEVPITADEAAWIMERRAAQR